jgi:hypothetical protein
MTYLLLKRHPLSGSNQNNASRSSSGILQYQTIREPRPSALVSQHAKTNRRKNTAKLTGISLRFFAANALTKFAFVLFNDIIKNCNSQNKYLQTRGLRPSEMLHGVGLYVARCRRFRTTYQVPSSSAKESKNTA